MLRPNTTRWTITSRSPDAPVAALRSAVGALIIESGFADHLVSEDVFENLAVDVARHRLDVHQAGWEVPLCHALGTEVPAQFVQRHRRLGHGDDRRARQLVAIVSRVADQGDVRDTRVIE